MFALRQMTLAPARRSVLIGSSLVGQPSLPTASFVHLASVSSNGASSVPLHHHSSMSTLALSSVQPSSAFALPTPQVWITIAVSVVGELLQDSICWISTLKRRRKKMNKHKLRKRRKKNRMKNKK